MIHRLSLILGLVASLAGCQKEEVHTVQYYVDNESQRTERMETCELQDRADEDANCVNARRALTIAASIAARKSWEADIEPTQPAQTK